MCAPRHHKSPIVSSGHDRADREVSVQKLLGLVGCTPCTNKASFPTTVVHCGARHCSASAHWCFQCDCFHAWRVARACIQITNKAAAQNRHSSALAGGISMHPISLKTSLKRTTASFSASLASLTAVSASTASFSRCASSTALAAASTASSAYSNEWCLLRHPDFSTICTVWHCWHALYHCYVARHTCTNNNRSEYN